MEVDSAVIGIESKFHAELASDQPAKYQATVQKIAEGLSEARGSKMTSWVVVLAPEARREEIVGRLDGSFPFLAWEDILTAIEKASPQADRFFEKLAKDFLYFARRKLDFLPDLDLQMPHLFGEFPAKGSETHCHLLLLVIHKFLKLRISQ